MKLLLSSRNQKKIKELRVLLEDMVENLEIVSLDDVGFASEIEETGATFEENSLIKAREAMQSCGIATVADDSGLVVDALGGMPGVMSARYAGEGRSEDACIDKLLLNLQGVPDYERTARFVCVITCCFPDGRVITSRGECEGVIARERRGSGRFGYDPVFYYPQYDMTFAQMDICIKNKISHRAVAMEAFKRNFIDAINN